MTSFEKFSVIARKFFTNEEWERFEDLERIRYVHLTRNYQTQLDFGLNPKKPEFMVQKRKRKLKVGDSTQVEMKKSKGQQMKFPLDDLDDIDDSDIEELRKFAGVDKDFEGFDAEDGEFLMVYVTLVDSFVALMDDSPCVTDKTADEPKPGKRYPKRNVARKNYQEEEIPDDDHYLFCDDCETLYEGDCPIHGPLVCIKNKKLPMDGSDPKRAYNSIPPLFSLCPSIIKGAGKGIWTEIDISKGVRFGPYEGITVKEVKKAQKGGYSWKISKEGKTKHYVDATDVSRSNWMRFVNCACHEEQQNLVGYQDKGEIFYRTYKDIKRGSELMVWYGNDYGKELGIAKSKALPLIEDDTDTPSTSDNLFRCDACSTLFTSEEFMKKHRKQHRDTTGAMRFKCRDCSYSTNHEGNLQKHRRTHTGEKPFKCQHCNKGFSQLGHLGQHLLIHSGIKPYKCHICSRSFNLQSNLKKHTHIHTDARLYACKTCKKTFTQKGSLQVHELIHTDQKPFKCPHCDLRFRCKFSVKCHVIFCHTRTFPHVCKVCEKGFIAPGELKKHQQCCHPTEE